jgi:hypothetical protein
MTAPYQQRELNTTTANVLPLTWAKRQSLTSEWERHEGEYELMSAGCEIPGISAFPLRLRLVLVIQSQRQAFCIPGPVVVPSRHCCYHFTPSSFTHSHHRRLSMSPPMLLHPLSLSLPQLPSFLNHHLQLPRQADLRLQPSGDLMLKDQYCIIIWNDD